MNDDEKADCEQEFRAAPEADGIVWKAMQARFTPEAFAKIIYKWGESKQKAAMLLAHL